MKQSFTAVLERNSSLEGQFATEPYEVAWASEARWFINTLSIDPGTAMSAQVQVSPDGLNWCDIDDSPKTVSETGTVSWTTSDFGGWLRLKGDIRNDSGAPEGRAKVQIYLALKG
ncbi:hypothetical protein ACFQ9D_12635 [Arthrobacter koreensis]|uniref:hypothetical protein n=1 Tax=Arthrobacter koreensis TaxID=199136 RepID=UPI00363474BD